MSTKTSPRNTRYLARKEAAKYRSSKPTMTDQSQAADTDVNIIMGKFGIGGTVTVTGKQPIYGDFTDLPNNLADMIRMARRSAELRQTLPNQLREMPDKKLFALTKDELTNILTPPQKDPHHANTRLPNDGQNGAPPPSHGNEKGS